MNCPQGSDPRGLGNDNGNVCEHAADTTFPGSICQAENLEKAELFLRWLDPHADYFRFRTFSESGGKNVRLKDISPDDLSWPTRENKENRGVFVTVNETDGNGQSKANITRVRAVWLDLDGAPLEPVLTCSFPPGLVVETSPDKFHCYWRAEDMPPEQAESLLKRMAAKFDSDSSVAEVARVLRVPGFRHLKNKPFLSRIVRMDKDAPVLSAKQIEEHLCAPLTNGHLNGHANGRDPDFRGPDGALDWQEITAALRGEAPGQWHSAMLKAVGSWVAAGVPDSTIIGVLMGFWDAPRSRPYSKPEVLHEITDAIKGAKNKGFRPDEEGPTEPLDLFSSPISTSPKPLDPELLPPGISAFATDTAKRLGCDVAMVALPCLSACATAIRDGWFIQPKEHDHTWLEGARLWTGIVGPVSSMKSPAILAATGPLKQIEREWGDEDDDALKDYEIEKKIYEKQLTAYIQEQAKGNNPPRPAEPERPPQRRAIVNDVTIEKLADILSDNPSGVLGVFDELTGWFGSFDAYRDSQSGKDRANWLELYNGSAGHRIDRIKRGSVRIPRWGASITGGIQPDKMRQLAPKMSDDGLIQRFLVAYVERAGDDADVPPEPKALSDYEQLLRKLMTLEAPGERVVIRLSPEAQQYRRVVESVVQDLSTVASAGAISPAFDGHLGKWRGMFARVLLVYHLCEPDGHHRHLVSGETAAKVAQLFLDYFLPSSARFYTDFFGDAEEAEHAKALAGYILAEKAERVSARDIYRHIRVFRKNKDAIPLTMETLRIASWAIPAPNTDPRATPQWDINPLVHVRFADVAEKERQRRGEQHQKILAATKRLKGGGK